MINLFIFISGLEYLAQYLIDGTGSFDDLLLTDSEYQQISRIGDVQLRNLTNAQSIHVFAASDDCKRLSVQHFKWNDETNSYVKDETNI